MWNNNQNTPKYILEQPQQQRMDYGYDNRPGMGYGSMQNGFARSAVSYIPGKIIAGPKDIMPNDVPMDGNAAVFLQYDQSCIYVKAWTADGRIDTKKYVLSTDENPTEQPPIDIDALMARFDKLEALVKKNRYYGKPKKESVNHE